MVVADGIRRCNVVSLAYPDRARRSFAIQLTAYTDPKAQVLAYCPRLQVAEAVDDRGNSLVIPDARSQAPQGPEAIKPPWSWALAADLWDPPNLGTRLVRFKATARFVIRTRMHVWEIKDPLAMRDIVCTAGGWRVSFNELTSSADKYRLRATIHSDGVPRQQWEQMKRNDWWALTAIRVLDEQDRELVPGLVDRRGSDDTKIGLDIELRPRASQRGFGRPARLIWEIPLEGTEVEVPFEFTDLPLP